jgi:hypothetical protein
VGRLRRVERSQSKARLNWKFSPDSREGSSSFLEKKIRHKSNHSLKITPIYKFEQI